MKASTREWEGLPEKGFSPLLFGGLTSPALLDEVRLVREPVLMPASREPLPGEPPFKWVALPPSVRSRSVKEGITVRSPSVWVTTAADTVGELLAPSSLFGKAESILDSALDEHFEDGKESDLSKRLSAFVRNYGELGLAGVRHVVYEKRFPEEVVTEALRTLGRLDDLNSRPARLFLLEQSLLHSSPIVRDGAALGIASMRDAHALASLRTSIEREWCSPVKKSMQQILDWLELVNDTSTATSQPE